MQFRWTAAVLKLTAAAGVALTVAGGPASAQTSPPADEPQPTFDNAYLSNAANIDAGKTVWTNQCRHCHGSSAYPGKAPKLNPGAYTPDFVYDRVTYGFRGMPPWKSVFTLEERKAVVAYIKSDSFSP